MRRSVLGTAVPAIVHLWIVEPRIEAVISTIDTRRGLPEDAT